MGAGLKRAKRAAAATRRVRLTAPQFRVLDVLVGPGVDRRLCLAPASNYTWMAVGEPEAVGKVAGNATISVLCDMGYLRPAGPKHLEITDDGRAAHAAAVANSAAVNLNAFELSWLIGVVKSFCGDAQSAFESLDLATGEIPATVSDDPFLALGELCDKLEVAAGKKKEGAFRQLLKGSGLDDGVADLAAAAVVSLYKEKNFPPIKGGVAAVCAGHLTQFSRSEFKKAFERLEKTAAGHCQ